MGRRIDVDRARIYAKIVGEEKRGGFCYELNGLFSWLLESLGFDVTLLSARVWGGDGNLGQEFDHLILRVDLDEPWLADVGFGQGFREPLRLVPNIEQVQPEGTYRLTNHGDDWAFSTYEEERWNERHRFMLTPHRYEEYGPMCHYHQTSPDSGFTKGRVYSQATPEGRITINSKRVTITRNGVREERELADEDAFWAAMVEHFGIEQSAISGQPSANS